MKVTCALCEFEKDGKCLKKKKQKINVKKKRICNFYKQSDDKVKLLVEKQMNSKPIPTTLRPDWWHDRRGYINKLKKLDKEKKRRESEMTPEPKRMFIEDVKHPLTGDLSKYTSTVSDNIPSKEATRPMRDK